MCKVLRVKRLHDLGGLSLFFWVLSLVAKSFGVQVQIGTLQQVGQGVGKAVVGHSGTCIYTDRCYSSEQ